MSPVLVTYLLELHSPCHLIVACLHSVCYQTQHCSTNLVVSLFPFTHWCAGLRLHDVFDMFCGCSIGSVLAMGIGAANKTARDLLGYCSDRKNTWSNVMPRPKNLVGPRYPAEGNIGVFLKRKPNYLTNCCSKFSFCLL